PGGLYRYLREEVRNGQLRHVVYGQGNGRSPGSVRQCADRGYRELDCRVRSGNGAQPNRGHIGFGCIEAYADASNGETKSNAKSGYSWCLGAIALTAVASND